MRHWAGRPQFIDKEDKFGAHNYSQLPVVLARGKGVHVWDVEVCPSNTNRCSVDTTATASNQPVPCGACTLSLPRPP